MTVLLEILILVVQLAGFLLALWLLFLLIRFGWRLRGAKERPRVPRARRTRRIHKRFVPRDRRQGARREADLVDEALSSLEDDHGPEAPAR